MKGPTKVTVLMVMAGTLAAGCNESAGIEDATEAVDKIQAQKENIVSQFNDILLLEEEMQIELEEDLAENEAALFANREARVFTSLDERQSLLNDMNDAYLTLEIEHELLETVLENGGEEELPVNELSGLQDQAASLHNEVGTYIDQYQSELNTQESFFNDLGAEDADFEFLVNGIEAINDAQGDIRDQAHVVHEELKAAETAIAAVQANEQPDEETALHKEGS
ncbi:outer membrane murein-binding lipoprotein Lpp [Geomicrobium halophilum]|uniref:Outer membrane murein-binding lipoprotein Lpp n=1 Tax=Geomicrobium halophilum TaxID=549000 RepID=A0A841PI25_9BACL|nr:YkyA family protein [Geomicrobium halophilum]MBB6448537.1 outer membrane murein-binding lipoprotein Lpp [Geomicrobium halophilum]